MRVLVVEDDNNVSHWLNSKLKACGHACRLVGSGESALDALAEEAFDVVVLDQMLPKMGGLEVLRMLSGRHHPPVLILSALNGPENRISGLRAGAEDYLGKPFHFDELLIRLELLSRRNSESETDRRFLHVEDLTLDVMLREGRRNGRQIDLTDKEFKLLHVLMAHKGQTVTRSMLLEKVWGYSFAPQTNLIDVHMSKLRAKVDRGCAQSLLRTVRAIGYVLG